MAAPVWKTTADGNYSTAGNWSTGSAPANGDTVRIPAGTPAITGGLDQSAVVLATFIVEEGMSNAFASIAAYLKINTARFEFSGTGDAYIDLCTTTVSPQIFKTATPTDGTHGLYLKGTGISVANIVGGDVAIAGLAGETATVVTARVIGSDAALTLGAGVTLTNLQQTSGKVVQRCAASGTVNIYGGEYLSREVGTIATLNAYGGVVKPESTGTITTGLIQGAEVDFTGSGAARTVSTLKHNSGTLIYDPAVLTITTRSAPDFPSRLTGTLGA